MKKIIYFAGWHAVVFVNIFFIFIFFAIHEMFFFSTKTKNFYSCTQAHQAVCILIVCMYIYIFLAMPWLIFANSFWISYIFFIVDCKKISDCDRWVWIKKNKVENGDEPICINTHIFFGQRNWKYCKYAHILPFHEIYWYRIIINYDDKGHCRTHKCNFVAIIVWRWWEVVYWRRCAENCIDFIFMAWRKNWHRRIERFIDLLSSSAFNGDFFRDFWAVLAEIWIF